jgi:hypothetical protein
VGDRTSRRTGSNEDRDGCDGGYVPAIRTNDVGRSIAERDAPRAVVRPLAKELGDGDESPLRAIDDLAEQ